MGDPLIEAHLRQAPPTRKLQGVLIVFVCRIRIRFGPVRHHARSAASIENLCDTTRPRKRM